MEQRTAEQKAYNRRQAKRWREHNPEAAQTITLRYYARKIFALDPDEIANLLTPRRVTKQ